MLAREHGIPFYIAAPTSTVDLSLPNGDDIQIEERGVEEVTHFQGARVAPLGVTAINPAFDITPHGYIGAIVTEEAGGRITDLSGKALDFRQGRTLANNTGICATNGRLHDRALEALAKLA